MDRTTTTRTTTAPTDVSGGSTIPPGTGTTTPLKTPDETPDDEEDEDEDDDEDKDARHTHHAPARTREHRLLPREITQPTRVARE